MNMSHRFLGSTQFESCSFVRLLCGRGVHTQEGMCFLAREVLVIQAEEVIDFEGEAGEAMLPNATYSLRSSKLNLACFTLTDDLFCHNL